MDFSRYMFNLILQSADQNYKNNYNNYRTQSGRPEFGQFAASWSDDLSEITVKFPEGKDDVNFFNSDSLEAGHPLNVIIREYEIKNDDTRGAQVEERFFSYDAPTHTVPHIDKEEYVLIYPGCSGGTVQGCDNCDPGEPERVLVAYRTYDFESNAENKEPIEIEKYVNQAVHSDIALDEVFSYDILAYVAQDADEVVITDPLGSDLEFAPTDGNVKVYDLGETTDDKGNRALIDSNHLPVYDANGEAVDNGDTTPSVTQGTEIDASKYTLSTENDTLTVTISNKLNEVTEGDETTYANADDEQNVTPLRGHYVRIHFDAQIKENIQNEILAGTMTLADLEDVEIKDADAEECDEPNVGNDPVVSDQDHSGIKNTASYEIKVKNTAKYEDTSNTVTVKPQKPEIEKYINGDVHAELVEFDKAFTYDILAYVTNDADKVVITDPLVASLEFSKTGKGTKGEASTDPAEVIERVAVKDSNDHTPNSTVADADADTNPVRVLTAGDYTAEIANNTLTITIGGDGDEAIKPSDNLRGKWIQVTFYAKYTDEAIKAAETNPAADNAEVQDNGLVESDETHEGTRNQASYEITVKNESKYESTSNTVTHDAETTELTVKKTWSEGTWPEDTTVTFGLTRNGEALNGSVNPGTGAFSSEGDSQATVELSSDKTSAKITGLPKLIDTTYAAQELKVNDTDVETDNAGNGIIARISEFINYIIGLITGGNDADGYTATINNEKVQTEKYVNNDVHANLVEFDKVIKYDILTYVSEDATEVTITDPLVSALEFARNTDGDLEAKAEATTVAAESIGSVVVKDTNSHKVNDTVTADGTPVGASLYTAEIANNTLTVQFVDDPETDDNELAPIQGKWLQVTFYAKYTQAMIDAAEVGDSATIADNGAVLEGETPHTGTTNQANVSMKVGNGATAEMKTNTVTTEAETIKVYVQKKWLDPSGTAKTVWPEGLTVDIAVKRTYEGGTTTVQTITVDGLEKVESNEFPKLTGATYSADEVEIPEGYLKEGEVTGTGTKDDPFVVTNKVIGEPEIEKYVNQAVHKYIDIEEEFTYDILAFVTADADKVVITDVLDDQLQFVSAAEEITVQAIGGSDNHEVTNNIYSQQVNDDASVAEDGADVEGAVVEVNQETKTLTVTIENDLDEEGKPADADKQYATAVRGQWIKITFTAKINETLEIGDLEYTDVPADVEFIHEEGLESREAPNIGNAPVKSDEAHDGVPNTASYEISVGNEAKYEDRSNTVTVKPEEPEIEKYVNEAVHSDVSLDEEFTFDIIAFITDDADAFIIKDNLDDQLQFVSGEADVKVVDLGTENNHKPANNISEEQVNADATVAEEGKAVEGAAVEIKGNTLTVTLDDKVTINEETGEIERESETVKGLRGHWVKVTFTARIKEGTRIEDLKFTEVGAGENDPVVSDEAHAGVPNKADYIIKVGNTPTYNDESNTVTVKPEKPEEELTSITVNKVWDDNDNEAGARPAEIRVKLLADGKETGKEITVKEGENGFWVGAFVNLPVGPEYTVKEVEVEGYASEVIEDGEGRFTILNSYEPGGPGDDEDGGKTPDDDDKDKDRKPDDETKKDEPKKEEKPGKSVATGDESNPLAYALLLLVAAGAYAGTLAVRRKRK